MKLNVEIDPSGRGDVLEIASFQDFCISKSEMQKPWNDAICNRST
jgi:hypothetical protein